MNAPKRTQIEWGGLTIVVYDFQVGDTLDWHEHPESSTHLSVITRGPLEMLTEGQDIVILEDGDVSLPGDGPTRHRFNARTAPARLINIHRVDKR